MEYALRDDKTLYMRQDATMVLILILMEYALRVLHAVMDAPLFGCLNPYSNGICSKSFTAAQKESWNREAS